MFLTLILIICLKLNKYDIMVIIREKKIEGKSI